MTFEEKLTKLTQIVERLEAGNELPLEESLKIFEEGVGLVNSCRQMLQNAELRVQNVRQLNHETDDTQQAGGSEEIAQ